MKLLKIEKTGNGLIRAVVFDVDEETNDRSVSDIIEIERTSKAASTIVKCIGLDWFFAAPMIAKLGRVRTQKGMLQKVIDQI